MSSLESYRCDSSSTDPDSLKRRATHSLSKIKDQETEVYRTLKQE